MIAFLLLQIAAAPPRDWSTLPLFPMPHAATVTAASAFVRSEVEAGRCKLPVAGTGVVAPVAILVGRRGAVTRIVPRAIGCPTVEQYTVGYLVTLTRAGPGSVRPPQPGWYRLTVSYAW